MIHQKKNGAHQTSNIVKSRQSYGNGHLPDHCAIFYLRRICVRTKDAQKRLAETINANVVKHEAIL